jgi:hypothetical protein
MAAYDKEPPFKLDQPYDDDDLDYPKKYERPGAVDRKKGEIIPFSGQEPLNIEAFLQHTLSDFNAMTADFANVNDADMYRYMRKALSGIARTCWDETLTEHLPNDVDRTAANFQLAINQFIISFTGNPHPRDTMLAYTAPLGPCKKDLLTPCHKHRHRWQQMMRHARMLPPGNTPWPDAIQLKEMFVHTFPRVHRAKYFSSKDIDSATETIDTITLYMKGLMEQDQADGTLQRLLEKHTRRKTAAYDSRKSRQRREKGRRQDLYDQRQYERRQRDRYERSHRSSGRDDRRSERRDDREGRSRKYSRREDGRREARDERRSTRNDDDVAECPKHGKVGHTWEQCRQNPDNWKKAANSAKSKGKKPSSKHSSYKAAVESHYQSDEESRRSHQKN